VRSSVGPEKAECRLKVNVVSWFVSGEKLVEQLIVPDELQSITLLFGVGKNVDE